MKKFLTNTFKAIFEFLYTEDKSKISQFKELKMRNLESGAKASNVIEWGYPNDNNEVIFLSNIYTPTHIKRHPYHIVKASMAPLMTTLPLVYFVLSLFNVIDNKLGLWASISLFVSGIVLWIFNIIFDSLYDQQHTYEVKRGLIMGMLLFIFSEVMFFFSFFWSYFYISLSPTIAIGCVWPPYGLTVYSYLGLPLLNTIILLLSGAILTDAYGILTEQKSIFTKSERYHAMSQYFNILKALFVHNDYKVNQLNFIDTKRELANKEQETDAQYLMILEGLSAKRSLDVLTADIERSGTTKDSDYLAQLEAKHLEYCFVTLFLKERNSLILTRLYLTLICAALFLMCQGYEYAHAPFSIQDGIYGSLFYLLTGFHGFHVLVGSILILIVTIRFVVGNFNLLNVGTQFQIYKNRSTGFACTLFYWHFVDVVWIFLYIVIYWWGSN